MHAILFLSLLLLGLPPVDLTGDAAFRAMFDVYNPGVGVKYADFGAKDDFFPISINNNWGFMNQAGDIIVWPQFDWCEEPYDGLARVVINNKTGFINTQGNAAIAPMPLKIDRFSEGFAIVHGPKGVGFIDRRGKLVIEAKFAQALRFSEGFAAVRIDDRCGFIDTRGQVVIPLKFKSVRSFHDGYAAFEASDEKKESQQNDKQDDPKTDTDAPRSALGYIDKRGQVVFTNRSTKISDMGDFREGYARVKVGDKWGYISKDFRIRIEPRFDDARDFCESVAAVKLNDRWGYIDEAGNVIITPRYDWAHDLHDGSALVRVKDLFGYTDRVGGWRAQPQFDYAEPYRLKLARAKAAPSFGYIGLNNNVVFHPKAPFNVIWNNRRAARLRGIIDTPPPAHVRLGGGKLDPPPYREPTPAPYKPEWKYRDIDFLPQPVEEKP